jgi:hypothetical protein
VILKLVTARTATARAAQFRRTMTALEAGGALRVGLTAQFGLSDWRV